MPAPIESKSLFQAQWPKSLEPALQSTAQKTCKVFWNIISVVIFPIGLVRLAGYYLRNVFFRCIVPGIPRIDTDVRSYWDLTKIIARFLYNPENFKANLTDWGETELIRTDGESAQFTAPDGAQIDGAFIPGKHKNKVILFVGGNAEQWETLNWHHRLKPIGASLLFLNPRGVGNSIGTRYGEGYALDTYAAAEYLIHEKGIDPENILFAGFSMGAANATRGAALIQEKYPDKKIQALNINSFSSLEKEIYEVLGTFGYLGFLASKLIGLNKDVKKAWDTLKGKKVIFHNPKDPVIPYPAQLATAVKQEPVGTSHLVELPSTFNHVPFTNEQDEKVLHSVINHLLEIRTSWFGSDPLKGKTITQVAL